MIGVGIDPGSVAHWKIALGVGERQRLGIWVSLALPVTIAIFGIGMCVGVGE